jgi:hypothetical protein
MQAQDALDALEAGHMAFGLGRIARTVELYERALAAADADATVPHDSALVAVALHLLYYARVRDVELRTVGVVAADDDEGRGAARMAAWRAEPRSLALAQRALALLLARVTAGTLFAPLTPLERRTCEHPTQLLRHGQGELPRQRAEHLFCVACDAAVWWPPLSDPAAEEARLRGVAGAARAVLTMHAHGMMRDGRHTRGVLLSAPTALLTVKLLARVLDADAATVGLLPKLRAINALTREEHAALRDEVLPFLVQQLREAKDKVLADNQERLHRAAEDVARHGLRACAMPGCGATEPQPKVFKVCSRCRRVCYCSQAHQAQDWRRHKREDACAAAPQ